MWPACPACVQVRVEAGCRVQQVADALRPHGLTLQNYASIREQHIAGFTQVWRGVDLQVDRQLCCAICTHTTHTAGTIAAATAAVLKNANHH